MECYHGMLWNVIMECYHECLDSKADADAFVLKTFINVKSMITLLKN